MEENRDVPSIENLRLQSNRINNDHINNTTRNESIAQQQHLHNINNIAGCSNNINNNQSVDNSNENNESGSEETRNEDCEYLKLLLGFKRTLMLPDIYFLPNLSPLCYCEKCCKPNAPLKGSSSNSTILVDSKDPEIKKPLNFEFAEKLLKFKFLKTVKF